MAARSELIAAAAVGDTARVRALLDAGADVNERTVEAVHVERATVIDHVETPLLVAVRGAHADTALLLLDRGAAGAERDAYTGDTPLTIAARRGLIDVVRRLIARGDADVDRALVAACDAQDPDHAIVDVLLAAGARAPAALERACAGGRLDLAARLHDGGVPLPSIVAAAASGRIEALDWLLGRGALLEDEALARAVHARELAMVERLLELGLDVDAPGRWGWTPLFYAASNGAEAIARLLLARGADRDHRDEQGKTAADWARAQGHEAVARLLG